MSVTPESVGITSKRGEPPKEGTQRILRTSDYAMGVAFNQNVKALREVQVIVAELLERVTALEQNTDRSQP